MPGEKEREGIAMKTYFMDGVTITTDIEGMDRREVETYLGMARKKMANLSQMSIMDTGDDMVTVKYSAHNTRFERIRRITGYLVGTIDRWNNAKRAEEQDRVKHIR